MGGTFLVLVILLDTFFGKQKLSEPAVKGYKKVKSGNM